MEKNIGKAVAQDLYKALADARAAFSAEERQEYDPQTLAEMFQHQINVNLRAAAEERTRNNQPETAAKLAAYAGHEFPDYNAAFNVTAAASESNAVSKLVRRVLADIHQLPALENEEPFDPNPWPNYNQILGVGDAVRQAKADIKSVRKIISDSKKLPAEKPEPSGEGSMAAYMRIFDAAGVRQKEMLQKKNEDSTKSSQASGKNRRLPDGPQPV